MDENLSILKSIKKLLGIQKDFNGFDEDIITHINSAFFTLNQLGVGPKDGYNIIDEDNEWTEFLGERTDLNAVKTYIYLNVKSIFDPPQMGYLVSSLQEQIKQFEWRLQVQGEFNKEEDNNEQ